jgi:hypothetical protein
MKVSELKKITWFGGSWGQGVELEKDSPTGLGIDQEEFRKAHRYTSLVSNYFFLEENNLSKQGVSNENLVRQVVDYVEKQGPEQLDHELLVIIWTSENRYFWIDHNCTEKDLRWDDKWWFTNVDNPYYEKYCAQRSIWSLHSFLQSKNIKYAMANGEVKTNSNTTKFYDISNGKWFLPPEYRVSDWLDFNLDQGYPSLSKKHKYFWPCESHPNLAGHGKIAQEIIKHLEHNI